MADPKDRPRRTRGPDKKPRKRRKDADTNTPPVSPGRPAGSKNALPLGAVAAIRSLRHRVPDETPDALAEVADEAFQTVVDIMRGAPATAGEVVEGEEDARPLRPQDAQVRLTAARLVREEVCGPVPKAHEITHKGVTSITVNTGVPRTPGDEGAEDPETVMKAIEESRKENADAEA